MTWNSAQLDKLLSGPAMGIPQVLAARDERVETQRRWLVPGGTLVCFNVNIPGEVKNCPLSHAIFMAGDRTLRQRLGDRLLADLVWDKPTGFTGFYRIDGEPLTLKKLLCGWEESCPAGRLWDFDVIGPAGPISRTQLGLPGRSCLLCGRPGSGCARSRAHTPRQLLEKMAQICLDAGILTPDGEEAPAWTAP